MKGNQTLMIPLNVRLDNLLGVIEFVADKHIQHKVWIEKAPGITSLISINELYCQYFDDNDMAGFIEEDLEHAPFSKQQKEAIIRFHNALLELEKLPSVSKSDDLTTLNTPEWASLVQYAKDTLQVFNA